MEKESKALEKALERKEKHRGEWITMEAAEEYMRKAAECPGPKGLDTGERRKLRLQLQERFGLLEIEAVNILNGVHVSFYVNKYRMIRECIVPGKTDESTERDVL